MGLKKELKNEVKTFIIDEIFRVYLNKNPDVQIIPINQNKEVDFMIKRAINSVK